MKTKKPHISIRRNIIIVIGIISLIVAYLIWLVTSEFFIDKFVNLQEEKVSNDLLVARNMLDNELENLEIVTNNLSRLDFMQLYRGSGNSKEGGDNHLVGNLNRNQLNFVGIVSSEGEVIYEEGWTSSKWGAPSSTLEEFELPASQVSLNRPGDTVSGFVQTTEGILMLSVRSMNLTQIGETDDGMVFIGRFLDSSLLDQIRNDLDYPMQLYNLNSDSLPADYQDVLAYLTEGEQIYMDEVSPKSMAGYSLINDIDGEPLLLIRIDAPTLDDVSTTRMISNYFVISLILATLFGVSIIWFIEKQVLSRLDVLVKGVSAVGESGDLTLPLRVGGNDELANLADQIRKTFFALNESRNNEERFRFDALHDSLTGLPNRSYFMKKLISAANRAEKDKGYMAAVLFIDFDRFKLVNDSYDHQMGDQVLVAVGKRLRQFVRPGDFVARLGGDEFAILLQEIDCVEDVIEIVESIQKAFLDPLEINHLELFMSASIGITFTKPGLQADELLRNADMAMYKAKDNGRGCYALFDEKMVEENRHLLKIETDLHNAIEKNEFYLNYQPIYSIKEGKVTALEALLRWNHPNRGNVSPGEFIPIAEETGLIAPIDEKVLYWALQNLKDWHAQGYDDLKIAVNISARELQDVHLPQKIMKALTRTCVSPDKLNVEITESAAMVNLERTIWILEELAQAGVNISIDDFGQGYSSLAYLHQFPANHLKIDQAFIRSGLKSADDKKLVSAIIAMGHSLDMDVIAEGVEEDAKLDFLISQNCDHVQGYLISRPLPVDQVEHFLKQQNCVLDILRNKESISKIGA